MESIVGSIELFNSKWSDNRASGFGAVLYIKTGYGYLHDNVMIGSNWNTSQDINSPSKFSFIIASIHSK